MEKSVPEISVVALECGQVRVRPKNVAGNGTPMLWWTLTARTWTERLPVYAFVIRHPKGIVLFDTGQSVNSLTDPDYYPKGLLGWVFTRQAEFTVGEGDSLGARLAEVGLTADRITLVALSHLHQDHAGNVDQLGGTPVLISRAEHDLLEEANPAMHGVLARHMRLAEFMPVDFATTSDPALASFPGSYDIFGDGSLVLLPTPGHSPGSMSLLIRRSGAAPLVLVGDATYDPALLFRGVMPDVGDRAVQLDTARRIQALVDAVPGLRIIAAHDPLAAATVFGAATD